MDYLRPIVARSSIAEWVETRKNRFARVDRNRFVSSPMNPWLRPSARPKYANSKQRGLTPCSSDEERSRYLQRTISYIRPSHAGFNVPQGVCAALQLKLMVQIWLPGLS